MAENHTLLSSVQSLINSTDSSNPFNSPSKLLKHKTQSLEDEYTSLRILNRKLWFGIWLYKFLNTPASTTPQKPLPPSSPSRKYFPVFSYFLISFTIFLSILIYSLFSYINKNIIS